MPHTRRSSPGSFVNFRLVTSDPDGSLAFYRALFDWTVPRIREAGAPGR
jgi:predicted enzyme related to lactoylglutathione lyase